MFERLLVFARQTLAERDEVRARDGDGLPGWLRRRLESPSLVQCHLLLWTSNLDRAERELVEILAQTDPEHPAATLYPLYFRGIIEWQTGRFDDAAVTVSRVMTLAEQAGWGEPGCEVVVDERVQ